jgi:hypothetical protein
MAWLAGEGGPPAGGAAEGVCAAADRATPNPKSNATRALDAVTLFDLLLIPFMILFLISIDCCIAEFKSFGIG